MICRWRWFLTRSSSRRHTPQAHRWCPQRGRRNYWHPDLLSASEPPAISLTRAPNHSTGRALSGAGSFPCATREPAKGMHQRELDYRNSRVIGLYDRMVGWDQLLPLEMPFYAGLLERYGCRTVLDAACGTGRHALALVRAGFEVSGSDVNEGMLRLARAHFGTAGFSLRLV